MKKYQMAAITLAILAQLAVPAYMIASHYEVRATGAQYRFIVNPVDPYDAFRGRYVSLSCQIPEGLDRSGLYAVIREDEEGFARIAEITNEKPAGGAYVKSADRYYFRMPIDRYYMEEKLAPRAERLAWEQGRQSYVTARIKNGRLVITGLFIDGEAVEELLKNKEAN